MSVRIACQIRNGEISCSSFHENELSAFIDLDAEPIYLYFVFPYVVATTYKVNLNFFHLQLNVKKNIRRVYLSVLFEF